MCTVSFVKHANGFSLTSNRDEQDTRPTIAPDIYIEGKVSLIYPKDAIAGGTWIASSDKNVSVCLLNGAFKKHVLRKGYSKSRGLVLKERFLYNSNEEFIENTSLDGIEPFTLLLIDHQNLNDIRFDILVWNEIEKDVSTIDTNNNHIWASSTLYNDKQRQARKKWFHDFHSEKNEIHPQDIIDFHSGSYTENKENDMLMKRGQNLRTISVTQINISTNHKNMIYKDLVNNELHVTHLEELCRTV